MSPSKHAQPSIPMWLIATGAIGLGVAISYAVISSGPREPAAPQAVAEAQPMPGSSTDPAPDADLSEWITTANIRMDEGRFADAARFYSRALEMDSLSADVWVDRGGCKHALGDVDGAIEDFRTALGLNPLHEIAHFNMGITYYSGGKPDSAATWWRKLLLISPGSPASERALRLLARIDSTAVNP